MIEPTTEPACDVWAWQGVVIDPGRILDHKLDSLRPISGRVFLEAGSHALSSALRLCDRTARTYAVTPMHAATLDGVTKDRIDIVRFGKGGVPLSSGSVDIAALRVGFRSWETGREADWLDELERIVGPEGVVALSVPDTQEGALAAFASRLLEPEASWIGPVRWQAEAESRRYQCHIVDTAWKAPGRSILRRLLLFEFADSPKLDLVREAPFSEIGCRYRLYVRP